MEAKRDWTTVTVVWMCLSALVMSVFWHIWNLVHGAIPVLTEVLWQSKELGVNDQVIKPAVMLTLLLGLSRSWDVLGAVLFSYIFCRLWYYAEADKQEEENDNLSFGLAFGLAVSLAFGLLIGLFFGLLFGLLIGPFFGLFFGLGYSFVIGLFWLGLMPGLAAFFIFTAPFWLIGGVKIAWRIFKNRSRADWSGVKQIVSGRAK